MSELKQMSSPPLIDKEIWDTEGESRVTIKRLQSNKWNDDVEMVKIWWKEIVEIGSRVWGLVRRIDSRRVKQSVYISAKYNKAQNFWTVAVMNHLGEVSRQSYARDNVFSTLLKANKEEH